MKVCAFFRLNYYYRIRERSKNITLQNGRKRLEFRLSCHNLFAHWHRTWKSNAQIQKLVVISGNCNLFYTFLPNNSVTYFQTHDIRLARLILFSSHTKILNSKKLLTICHGKIKNIYTCIFFFFFVTN